MKKFFTGRSMVEMLGVLAIIGVLSISGVSMYRKAILNYRLGQTQHWFENARFIFAEACANGNTNGCFTGTGDADYVKRREYVCAQAGQMLCKKMGNNLVPQTPLKEKYMVFFMGVNLDYLRIYMQGLDKRTCEALIDYDWHGLRSIYNYNSGGASASVQSGQKHLTQEQKEHLKSECPYPQYIVLQFDLKS